MREKRKKEANDRKLRKQKQREAEIKNREISE
jgi:hypothetical protein